ncbi:Peroxisomal membrane protein pex16 [Gaertneriomyces sp. JEL0708]|nr:Peroxisomal membrane protein pex16 [Gaertneriomyces sp. JEL0708]
MLQLVDKYEQFVLKNAPQISGIESGIRSLTYILPGRFNDADMASEAIFAAVNLMSLYHDSILAEAALAQQPEAPVTRFNRYTRHMLRNGSLYRTVAYALTLTQLSEALMEMVATKVGGHKGRGRAIIGIEAAKVVCRIMLLRLSRGRMLLHSNVPERDYDMSTVKPLDAETPSVRWVGKRTGREHLHVDVIARKDKGGYEHAMQYLLSKALVDSARTPIDLLKVMNAWRTFGDYLFTLRPLVYVLALKKYGRRSWKPLIISLVTELLSLSTSLSSKPFGFREDLTPLEKDEYKRRCWYILYYLLRNPLYDKYTKDRLDGFITSASQKPLISLIAGVLRDYQPLWEKWHFYTSAY